MRRLLPGAGLPPSLKCAACLPPAPRPGANRLSTARPHTCGRSAGPFNNPQETYNYYELPFCKRDEDAKPVHKWGGLGEVLEGNELIDSQLELSFRTDQERTTICEQTLDDKTARRFRDAVTRHYWHARARARLRDSARPDGQRAVTARTRGRGQAGGVGHFHKACPHSRARCADGGWSQV